MDLQKVMAGAGGRELEEAEADAATAARRNRERVQQAGRGQMIGLDALARGAGPHEVRDCGREAWPPHRAAGQREGLVAPKMATEGRRMQLAEDLRAECAARGDAEAVTTRAAAIQEPGAPDEGETSAAGPPPQ